MRQEPLTSAGESSLPVIYTIGHSNHEVGKFVQILHNRSIQLLADVRSIPYSKRYPQFNKGTLKNALINAGIKYLFFGKELGARPKDRKYYIDGKVSFKELRSSSLFKEGISRLLNEAIKYNTVIMCSEKEPINCHRAILISRALTEEGVPVKHILSETETLDHLEMEEDLLKKFKIQETLFDTKSSKKSNLNEAYKRQEEMISHQKDAQKVAIW